MLGVMKTEEALEIANNKKLDLVSISPNANPPVCKILDYGKYRYELQKREKEAKKKQKTTQLKEIRLSTFIEEHDIQVKANTALKFLKDGDKLKVSLRFRGREKDYASKGMQVMKKFAEIVSEFGVIEKRPEFEGRSLIMIMAGGFFNMAKNKMKSHRGACKRLRLTGTGKVKRNKAYKSHILTKKAAKRKRGLRKATVLKSADLKRMLRAMAK